MSIENEKTIKKSSLETRLIYHGVVDDNIILKDAKN